MLPEVLHMTQAELNAFLELLAIVIRSTAKDVDDAARIVLESRPK